MSKKASNDEFPTSKLAVIDLFCGAGGLAYGLKSAGLSVLAGVDLDPACRYPLEFNTGAKFIQKDVKDVSALEINEIFNDAKARVLAGCAPCQPFSTYAQGRKTQDIRWNLLQQFQRLAISVRPEIVTMENVPGLAHQTVWKDFVEALENAGYYVWSEIVMCTDFGVPQTRRRLVLIASLFGPIKLLKQEGQERGTVRQAIANLPAVEPGAPAGDDRLHKAASLSQKNLERIRASRPGGTWRDWPETLRANCHTKLSGKSYPSVYGRMEWERPAPTMTTQCYGFGNGRFGHPEQDRAITLREAALIQSFPRHYEFLENNTEASFSVLGTLIGNAVPPKLGEAIGKSIIDHFEVYNS